ncbi:MAG: 5'-methylthioadenosine/S-adenosylhomocysteine nucleosidase [candidate division Zixibacteria bacterium]|nr:5'-methylthioadenosine/S-adenosylhomocysteine nucleosidase [candidate division Zixibacteria bacterium]
MNKTMRIIILLVLISFASLLPGCANIEKNKTPYLILYAFDTEGELLAEKMTVDTTQTVLGRTVYIGQLSGQDIVLAESGVGMTNAALTAQKMIDLFSPRGVFFSGIAGAVDTGIDIGDIVICDRWITHDYGYYGAAGFQSNGIRYRKISSDSSYKSSFFPVDSAYLETSKRLRDYEFSFEKIAERAPKLVVSGVGVSGNSFIDNYDKRVWLSENFQALVVDMETAAVAQVCIINEVPFIGFRSASDLAGGSGSSTASVEIDQFFKVAAVNSSKVLIKFLEEI